MKSILYFAGPERHGILSLRSCTYYSEKHLCSKMIYCGRLSNESLFKAPLTTLLRSLSHSGKKPQILRLSKRATCLIPTRRSICTAAEKPQAMSQALCASDPIVTQFPPISLYTRNSASSGIVRPIVCRSPEVFISRPIPLRTKRRTISSHRFGYLYRMSRGTPAFAA